MHCQRICISFILVFTRSRTSPQRSVDHPRGTHWAGLGIVRRKIAHQERRPRPSGACTRAGWEVSDETAINKTANGDTETVICATEYGRTWRQCCSMHCYSILRRTYDQRSAPFLPLPYEESLETFCQEQRGRRDESETWESIAATWWMVTAWWVEVSRAEPSRAEAPSRRNMMTCEGTHEWNCA